MKYFLNFHCFKTDKTDTFVVTHQFLHEMINKWTDFFELLITINFAGKKQKQKNSHKITIQ